MKTQVVDWHLFMSGSYRIPSKREVVLNHIERNKTIYRVAAATAILLVAADFTAFASTSLDAKASAIYHDKLLGFGKWALIIRGGWSTIQKSMQEDFDGAKKQFFTYLMVYLFLLAFPWAMREMDGIFA